MTSAVTINHLSNLSDAEAWWRSQHNGSFETDPAYFRLMLTVTNGNQASVCLYDNPFIQRDGKKTLVFGNLVCPDDKILFDALFAHVLQYAKGGGYRFLFGPFNGNTWNSYRLPLEQFGAQFISDLPHPEHYTRLLTQEGFTVAEEYYSYLSDLVAAQVEPALMEKLNDAGVSIRDIRLDRYRQELEKIYDFCQLAFANNLYFSPTMKENFIEKYLSVEKLIDPQFVTLAENRQNELQAIYFALPDTHQQHRLVIKTIARLPGEEVKGIMVVLSQELYNRAVAKGYRDIIHAFMHSSNRSVKLSQRFNGRPFKKYGLFLKDIDGR